MVGEQSGAQTGQRMVEQEASEVEDGPALGLQLEVSSERRSQQEEEEQHRVEQSQ